ncbi:hypothetical protein CHGG_03748 [Chaetomium globosum CBS 148.51]|uniref:Uncharacterized protein n=1 Tax=Chaetomium globosum (strain ATCC 6205 / CBS 148.51 / DSM 1962 / NBRC 6347 / NRRL 1970) TaxID=306901 RepID=Q2H398_CHAGB|nr:uncharacterized protein CHGG_03748 [Chaetomium globosum CBS 148.51]EAQ87129.1 hypothetical protein CHGG_03748 [Chaetomium globosum CBS 148.51]
MDLGTVLTVVELVQKAITIYERIENLPQQMAQLGRRMENLNLFLVRLQNFLTENNKNDKNNKNPKTQLLSGQLNDLRKLLAGIKANAEKVYDLFDRYKSGILSRSKDLKFRASWMTQVWFSIVDSSADKVQVIMEDIDQQRSLLRDYLVLMAVEKAYEPPATTTTTTTTRPGRDPAQKPPNGTLAATSPIRRPPPSPSPTPPRRDYKILFVDPYNEARSVVAEALVKLLAQLTLRARNGGGDWRIGEVSSAGFFTKRKNEAAGAIDALDYSERSFQLPWRPGGAPPDATALSAVFDNRWADYPFKKDVRKEILARTSRGVPKDVFARFDFVFVFTVREHDNMVKLKEALLRREGPGAAPRCKGRVLQLGAYLAHKRGQVREILNPVEAGVKSGDLKKKREAWNQQVSEIRTALKAFLKQEMRWTPPDDQDIGSPSLKGLEAGKK